MPDREQAIQSAISGLQTGRYQSEREAATAQHIPRSTLRDRLYGAVQRSSTHAERQRLGPDEEGLLTYCIVEMARFGHPPSHAKVRDMATRMLSPEEAPLGKLWIRNSIRRSPRVAAAMRAS